MRPLLPILVVGLGVVAALGANPTEPQAAVIGAAATVKHQSFTDPFPIRRQFVSQEQLERILTTNGKDKYQKLLKTEFESLVELAAREKSRELATNGIVEAEYKATLANGHLRGLATWKFPDTLKSQGVRYVSLDPLDIAIHSAQWGPKQPAHIFRATLAGRNAPGTYLLRDDSSSDALTYQWSLRGSNEPDEDRFTLQVPASPIAVLKLSMINERIPVVTQPGVVVTGPYPSADNKREQLWHFRFGNLNKLQFSIRRPVAADSQAVVLAKRTMKWQIRSYEITGTAEVQLDSTRGVPNDLNFAVDNGCMVADVTGERVSGWSMDKNILNVKLTESVPNVRLSIALTAPSGRGPFTFNLAPPVIQNAILEADLLEYTLAPDVRLEGWTPAEYRITGTRVLLDRSKIVNFRGSLLSNNDNRVERKPPNLRLRASDVEYTADIRTEWTLEPTQSRLTSTVKVQAVRGPLVSFPVQAMPGYVITGVTSTPDDSGITWIPLAPNGWTIEPTRAIPTGKSVEFRIEFRAPTGPLAADAADPSPAMSQALMPRITTPGAQETQASLRVNTHPGIIVKPSTNLPDTDASKPHSIIVNHRNRPAEGDVLFATLKPSVEYSSEAMVHWDQSHSTLTTRMIARTADYPLGSLTVFVPGDDTPRIYAQGIAVQIVRHWPTELTWNGNVIPPSDPWTTVLHAAMSSNVHGSFWRIKFNRPVADSVSIVIQSELKHGSSKSGEYALNIPTLLGAQTGDIKVSLDEPTSARFRVVDALERPFLGHTYRIIPGSVPTNRANPELPNWSFTSVRQHNSVSSDGQIEVTFTGIVERAASSELDVDIAGVTIDRVNVDGKEVLDPRRRSGDPVRIPVRSGATFEIQYRIQQDFPRWQPFMQLKVPSPLLQVDYACERWWRFTPQIQPWPTFRASPGIWLAGSDTMRIVHTDWLTAIGRLVAVITLLVGMIRLRHDQGSIILGTSVVALTGIGQWVGSPVWAEMFQPVLLTALIVVVANLIRRGVYQFNPSVVAAASSMLILPTFAQAPEVATAYITQSRTGEYVVHAPITAIKTLNLIGQSPIPGAIVTTAEYHITGGAESSSIEAKYLCQVTRSGPQILELPLTGVQLESATLDDKEAFPDASKADRLTIPIQDIGEHTLKLKFQVTTLTQGIDRNIQFGIPEVPDCKVAFNVKNGQRLDAVSRTGEQTILADSLTAEHGAAKSLQVRWRENTTVETSKPTFSVREAMLWDIDESQSRLTAAFLIRVTAGSLSDVRVEIPEELAVVSVTCPGVRSWKLGKEVVESMKPLDIILQNPVEGKLTLVVQAVMRTANTPRPTLRFPRAAGLPDADRESNLAIRSTGVSANNFVVPNAVDIPIEAFTKDFATVAELKLDTSAPERVLRSNARRVELRPPLTIVNNAKPIDTQIQLTVGRRLEWTGDLRAELKDANVLEYDVPASIRVHHVIAPGLAGWARTGNRLQAWWRNRPKGEVKLQWFGSSTVETPTRAGVSEWALPRWPVNNGKVMLSMQSAIGWQAIPQPGNGIAIVEDAILEEYQLQIEPNVYSIKVHLQTTGESPFVFSAIDTAIKPIPLNPSVPHTTQKATPTETTPSAKSSREVLLPWLFALVFTLSLTLLVVITRHISPRFWPESLVAYGGLSAWALGFLTTWGFLALSIVAIGLLARIVQLLSSPKR